MKQVVRAVVQEVNKSVQSKVGEIEKSVNENAEAIKSLLDGMGLLKEVEKSAESGDADESGKVEKSGGEKPNKPMIQMTPEQYEQILAKSQGSQPHDDGEMGRGLVESFEVRKSGGQAKNKELGAVMGSLFGVNNQNSGRF